MSLGIRAGGWVTAEARAPVGVRPVTPARLGSSRVTTDGKFLSLDDRVFRVRGVTYGSFAPRGDGAYFPETDRIRSDFAAMAASGLNTVRIYTLPEADVLEAAQEAGLRLLIGLHLDDWLTPEGPGRRAQRRILDAGRRQVAAAMERCAGRPEVLAISVGNEVKADFCRLYGRGAVEEVLSTLVEDVHAADPAMLATYSNFPTTEYLQVEGQDLVCFNVFLERPERFRAYLDHLQVVSGDLPLVITELGLAAELKGAAAQAELIEQQLWDVDRSGCAGATVFCWTDEWAVAGNPVRGWGFGLTAEDRSPKPALGVVEAWAARSIADLKPDWPRVSAIVCAYNAAATLCECLESLARCQYPNLEVIVCDDGSTDGTAEIADRFPFRRLPLPRGGLSAARNAGIQAAGGEIVAFLDADAACHPEWPYHLVLSMDGGAAGTGGPNLPVPGAGLVERAVAQAPGNPVHVLISDDQAEHVPGCNMAFRKDTLESVGGFDVRHRAAGDDIDVCFKVLDRDLRIAFAPQAQVRHHRRGTVRGYLRQQRSYGRAERVVAAQHPHRFNAIGQARWAGSIYGGPAALQRLLQPIIYYGWSGQAPYQPVVRRRWERLLAVLSVYLPVWLPLGLAAGLLAPLSMAWLAAPIATMALLIAYATAVAAATQPEREEARPASLRWLVAFLHVAQPLVRTWARARPSRDRVAAGPLPVEWSGDRLVWVRRLYRKLSEHRLHVVYGSPIDPWDLQVSAGPFLQGHLTTAVAWDWVPHYRLRLRPRPGLLIGFAAVATLGLFALPIAGLLLTVIVAWSLVDAVRLRRLTEDAVRATTGGLA
ncbi:MAG: glycosyltransferase [Candidatus Dormibacteraeota bacterium]|nr:glycosyltransferase [Candidatus Dormibacteraeota bacterium]